MKLCNELHSHLHEIQKCFSQKVSISFFSKTLNGIDYNAFYMHQYYIAYDDWHQIRNSFIRFNRTFVVTVGIIVNTIYILQN